jgi:very-short-patch-repair endonuclease
VYAVGHTAPAPLRAELAALMALGPAAVLSHGSAAMVWGLPAPPTQGVHVVLTRGQARSRPGLTVHRAVVGPREVRTRDGLRLTSPARTIADVAAVLDAPRLERVVAEALALRLVRADELRVAPGRPGAAALRAVLDAGPRLTRSEAERRLLTIVRDAALPVPRTNARVAGHEVDAWWPDRRLAVEVDGYAFHGGRARFERDRRRDLALHRAGVRVVRVSWRQLAGEPLAVVAAVAAALAA